jgi:hypothetical protein
LCVKAGPQALLGSVSWLEQQPRCARPTARTSKPYGRPHEAILKQTGPTLHQVDKGPHVMWTIINALYEEYCQARLDEMLRIETAK